MCDTIKFFNNTCSITFTVAKGFLVNNYEVEFFVLSQTPTWRRGSHQSASKVKNASARNFNFKNARVPPVELCEWARERRAQTQLNFPVQTALKTLI